MHGCIVCGKVFNILAVYAPDGMLVDCKVTSPGGHCVPDKQPLAACDSHSSQEIETAHKKWQSLKGKETNDEDDDE